MLPNNAIYFYLYYSYIKKTIHWKQFIQLRVFSQPLHCRQYGMQYQFISRVMLVLILFPFFLIGFLNNAKEPSLPLLHTPGGEEIYSWLSRQHYYQFKCNQARLGFDLWWQMLFPLMTITLSSLVLYSYTLKKDVYTFKLTAKDTFDANATLRTYWMEYIYIYIYIYIYMFYHRCGSKGIHEHAKI